MTDAINNLRLTGHSAFRKAILLCIVLISAFSFTACQAKGPEMVGGLGVELLNYSQLSIVSVNINGENVGVSTGKAKVGETKGGGVVCCSGEISVLNNTANVTIETVRFINGKNGDVINETYTTQALVELPLPPPDLRNTLIIHVLPGRKVVLEVTSFATFGRQDLLEAQIKTLGIKQEVPFSDLLRTGPNTYKK